MASFPATHILAFEKEGRMVEVLVMKEGASLLTKEEWAAHSVPDWTFEDDGRLYYCGEDFAGTLGQCSLRPVGGGRIRLEILERLVKGGHRDVLLLSQVMKRSVEEIETSLATLERLGRVVLQDDDTVSPVWEQPG